MDEQKLVYRVTCWFYALYHAALPPPWRQRRELRPRGRAANRESPRAWTRFHTSQEQAARPPHASSRVGGSPTSPARTAAAARARGEYRVQAVCAASRERTARRRPSKVRILTNRRRPHRRCPFRRRSKEGVGSRRQRRARPAHGARRVVGVVARPAGRAVLAHDEPRAHATTQDRFGLVCLRARRAPNHTRRRALPAVTGRAPRLTRRSPRALHDGATGRPAGSRCTACACACACARARARVRVRVCAWPRPRPYCTASCSAPRRGRAHPSWPAYPAYPPRPVRPARRARFSNASRAARARAAPRGATCARRATPTPRQHRAALCRAVLRPTTPRGARAVARGPSSVSRPRRRPSASASASRAPHTAAGRVEPPARPRRAVTRTPRRPDYGLVM